MRRDDDGLKAARGRFLEQGEPVIAVQVQIEEEQIDLAVTEAASRLIERSSDLDRGPRGAAS